MDERGRPRRDKRSRAMQKRLSDAQERVYPTHGLREITSVGLIADTSPSSLRSSLPLFARQGGQDAMDHDAMDH